MKKQTTEHEKNIIKLERRMKRQRAKRDFLLSMVVLGLLLLAGIIFQGGRL